MKAHELAQKLLNGPNLDVMIEDNPGILYTPSSPFKGVIDETNDGEAEDRIGEEVVKIVVGSY
jgi:hypothetical protein